MPFSLTKHRRKDTAPPRIKGHPCKATAEDPPTSLSNHSQYRLTYPMVPWSFVGASGEKSTRVNSIGMHELHSTSTCHVHKSKGTLNTLMGRLLFAVGTPEHSLGSQLKGFSSVCPGLGLPGGHVDRARRLVLPSHWNHDIVAAGYRLTKPRLGLVQLRSTVLTSASRLMGPFSEHVK